MSENVKIWYMLLGHGLYAVWLHMRTKLMFDEVYGAEYCKYLGISLWSLWSREWNTQSLWSTCDGEYEIGTKTSSVWFWNEKIVDYLWPKELSNAEDQTKLGRKHSKELSNAEDHINSVASIRLWPKELSNADDQINSVASIRLFLDDC